MIDILRRQRPLGGTRVGQSDCFHHGSPASDCEGVRDLKPNHCHISTDNNDNTNNDKSEKL